MNEARIIFAGLLPARDPEAVIARRTGAYFCAKYAFIGSK